MRILMLGTDAFAGLLAAELALEDHDVTVLAQGDRYEQLRWHGIELRDADSGAEETVPIRVVDGISPDDAFDLLIATGDVADEQGLLPPPPWAIAADVVVLPQDAERAATILGGSDLDLRSTDAHFEGDTVVYRMPPRARLTPIGMEAPVGAAAGTTEEATQEAEMTQSQELKVGGEPHGWLPTAPPKPEFAQPPATGLPPSEPETIEEDFLVAHVGQTWMPTMPEASEGDTPWPEPMTPPERERYEESVQPVRKARWPWVVAGVAVWLGWRMLRRSRRR